MRKYLKHFKKDFTCEINYKEQNLEQLKKNEVFIL